MTGPVVVKLGGSFAFSVHLRTWIAALAACAGEVVVVPGGGPFADAVRAAQARMGFDDRAAHHMAVLAMEQYGRALISLDAKLAGATSIAGIRRHLLAGRVPVWMPAPMVLAASEIPQTWEATSDTLAAWLAGRLEARLLMLVKHRELPAGGAGLDELTALGIVDAAFARHLRMGAVAACVLGPAEHEAAVQAIRAGAPAGIALG